jgi:hypothetical protein
MAAISLFWYTNMAAVTSDENDLYKAGFYIDKTREFIIINSILFINPTFPWRDIKSLPLL